MSGSPQGPGARLTDGSLLARNAYLNLFGQGVPIVVAIVAIPLLIAMLGAERFGILSLAWVVLNYFGLFDFGLSRATTKFVAEHQARDELDELPALVWSSLAVHGVLGLLGAGALAALTPWLTEDVLNVPASLVPETKLSFYLLAASVPFSVATSALRGVLEAAQRFDMVNAVKVPVSTVNYLGPLPVLLFSDSLAAVVAVLAAGRVLATVVYLLFCLRAMPVLRSKFVVRPSRVWPLVGFGGWLSVSTFVGATSPIDRLMLGAFVSMSAVAAYTVPFEVVTRLMIFPLGLLAVLFPAFSALSVGDGQRIRRLCARASRCLLALVAPFIGLLLALSYDLLDLWVSTDLALEATPIAKWLAIGVLINALAFVPLTALQGVGRADVTAKLQLAIFPFYVLLTWYLLELVGATGAAIAWTIREAVTAAVFFVTADRLLPSTNNYNGRSYWSWIILPGFLLAFLLTGLPSWTSELLKLLAATSLLLILGLWEWRFLLQPMDRRLLLDGVKPIARYLGNATRS